MTHALTRRGFPAASAALAGANAMAHHAWAQSAVLTLRAATRTLGIGGRAATVYGLVNAAGGQGLILDPGQRTAADLAADRQAVVMALHDFSFKPAEEVLTEVTGGVGHDVAGMDHGAPAASGTMVSMTDMPGMGMDLNDFNFDAYLANDRTLSDPDVIRVEKGGRVRLRIINTAAATAFRIDTGAVPGRLVAVDGHDVVPVIGARFGMAMGQRPDVELDLPAGTGAFPILALREGARERTGIILATAGAEVARIEGVAEADAPAFDNGLAQELTLRAVAPLATRPASKTRMMMLGGSMQRYVWMIDGKTWGDHVPVTATSGERVEIMFHNMSMMGHPMHVHGHAFQVVGIGNQRFAGAVRDTVCVPPMTMVTIAIDADEAARWMLHCHHMPHLATGMMTEFAVSA